MDMQQFYEEVSKIVLFPGSVHDLNRMESEQYELMPVDGPYKFLTGIIIPNQDEIEHYSKSDLEISLFETEEMGFAQFATQMFSDPKTMDTDLRIRAKRMGADGLVHFQKINDIQGYMGVPVRYS